MAIITHHAADRGKERCGLSLGAFRSLSEKALKEGISHSECKGQLKKYVDALYLSHGKASNIKIFGEFVYLFKQDVLITVIHLPNQFKKIVAKKKKHQ